MSRVNASPVPAEMINAQAFRYRAERQFVGDPVRGRHACRPAAGRELAVAVNLPAG
jgi:hypothetical protein